MFNKLLKKTHKAITYPREYNYGFVLSGGAARGFAHVGVIKALEEHGIYPDVISGVSAGAIVGAMYADGYSTDEMFDIFSKKRLWEFTRLVVPKHGLLDISGLRHVLEQSLRSKRIEDLKKPLYITATNFKTGVAEYFSKGNLVDAIVASSSIPVLFKPAEIEENIYVDGGIIDNFPIEPIRKKCHHLVGIHVNPIGKEDVKTGLLSIAIRTFHLSVAAELEKKITALDYFFEPQELRKYGIMDISKAQEMCDIGYESAKKVLAGKKDKKETG